MHHAQFFEQGSFLNGHIASDGSITLFLLQNLEYNDFAVYFPTHAQDFHHFTNLPSLKFFFSLRALLIARSIPDLDLRW